MLDLLPKDQPAPARRFPRWTVIEQDFWFDVFQQYSGQLLDLEPDELLDMPIAARHGGQPRLMSENAIYYKDKIALAADLADEAVIQMQYRFYRQQPINRQEPRDSSRKDRGDKNQRRRKRVRSR